MGSVFDKFGVLVGAISFGIFCILVPIFALLSHQPTMPWLLGVFMGLSAVGFSLTGNIFVSEFFGQKDFAAILSRLTRVATFGGALSPPVMGLAYDLLGEYTAAWFVLLAIGILITFSLVIAVSLNKKMKKS